MRRTILSLEADLANARLAAKDAQIEASRLRGLFRQLYRAGKQLIDAEGAEVSRG